MTTHVFDPARYLRKLGKGEYLEVKWRLVWLRTEHPDAIIRTELVEHSHEQQFAMFRATASIPGGGEATGYGSETRGDFNDYIEKAETKAIGRALGALGYGTQFSEDFDCAPADGNGRMKVVDAPVERPDARAASASASAPPANRPAAPATPAATGNGNGPVRMVSENQMKAIYAVAWGARGMDETDVKNDCVRRYNIAPVGLTMRQASAYIDLLKVAS